MRIALCDVGLGNLRSVERALVQAAGMAGARVTVTRTRDPDAIASADKVVMPGQGGFGDCARALADGGGALAAALRSKVASGAPYLGICLGLQVLFETSAEAPGCAGLGLFEGSVARLPGGVDPLTGGALKIPHVGWNAVRYRDERPAEHFYFVHSYAVVPRDPAIILATTDYGGDLVSAVRRDNVLAVQFHPEKSQRAGLDLLAEFVRC